MNESVKILLEVIDKASPQLQQFQNNLQKTGNAAQAFGTLLKGLAFASVGAAFVSLIKGAIDTADSMNDASERLGITTESLSALGYAAKMSGTNIETLQTGLQQLNKSIVEAQDPSSAAANAFKYMGISIKDASGNLKGADKVFAEMADAFTRMPEGPSKTAVAMELLGKGGAALIPILNSGKAGLEEYRAEAERLGVVISTETAKQAGQFNDSLDRMSNASAGAALTIAKEMTPTLNALAVEMIDTVTKGEDFKNFAKGVGAVFKWVVKAGAGVVVAFNIIGKGIGALAAAGVAVFNNDFKGAKQIMSDFADDANDADEKYKEFVKKIDAGVPPIEKNAKATNAAGKALGEYAGKSKEAKDAKDAENKAFEKAYAAMLKESEGYKDLTAVRQVEYNIQKQVAGFRDPDHQKKMLQLAAQIDAQRVLNATIAGQKDQLQTLYTTADGVKKARAEAEQYQLELIKYGQRVADIMATQRSQARSLEADIVSLSIELRTLQESDPVANEKRITDIQAQLDGRLEILNTTKEENGELRRNQLSLTVINHQTQSWNELVGDNKQQLEDVTLQYGFIQSALNANVITQEQFNSAVARLDAKKFGLMKSQLTELEKKTADFAGQIQSTFGDVFYNIMQGNFKDIGTMFKQMLDKMVAEALAAKLAQALFGDFRNTGSVSGQGGGLLTSLVGTLFSGMYRADGGSVSAGQPYIVGERRPELFVPRTSGTILPDTSALAMAGGNNVQFSITAMDSQDVLRAMDKIKRPLADMMNGTNRAYNLG